MDTFRRQSSGVAPSVGRGPSTRRLLGLSGGSFRGDADASQLFSIETRLELKTRLTKLQSQLRQLLVQSKLAWMRCFVEPRTSAASAAAVQLVQLGEELTASLSRAFDLAAGTATAPLTAYQALVTQVESKMSAFQQLVDSLAHGNFPKPEEDSEDDSSESEEEHEEEGEEEQVTTYLHRPIHVDLPSMQTYCKQVAPPYSSYLPAHLAKKKHPH